MKKLYGLFCGLLLAGMLLVGLISIFDKDAAFSQRENRKLQSRPKVTFSALLDGTYTTKFSAYYTDTFPGRESLMGTNKRLNGFYRFGGTSNTLVVDRNTGAADHGESLRDPTASTNPGQPDGTSGTTNPTADTTVPTETTQPKHLQEAGEVTGVTEQLGSVVLVGNRALDVPYGSDALVERYAGAVTDIANALGSGVRTFSMPVPNAAAFYAPSEYRSGISSQTHMLELVRDSLGDNVIFVDSYTKLLEHTEDYIYFRTDHHWTQLGAYYAYQAFCETAGFTVPGLGGFEKGTLENFVGSMYTYISDYPQSQVLLDDPDTLVYYRPKVECTTTYYSDTTLSDPVPIGAISGVGDTSNKYLTFLGGDHPITIIDSGKEGKVCILIKESYGNAFAPWLINNYAKVICIDPREFNREGMPKLDLAAFAAEQGVSDCIVMNYPMMLNSENYIAWLQRLVGK